MFQSGDQLRQFVLKKEIYTSGLSQIWSASHHRTGRTATLKIALTWDIPKTRDTKARKSVGETANSLIRNEASILPYLSHPNIVHIFPLHTDDDVEYCARAASCRASIKPWYFAMKEIEGSTLTDCLSDIIKQTSFQWRMELFYQLLITVEYMHLNGYAHMDLKPENIMVGTIDPAKRPHLTLIDLGCASSELDDLTTEPGGTDHYAPLELLVAMHSDLKFANKLQIIPAKVDIWSLGAIFFELVTGSPLFSETEDTAITISDTLLKKQIKKIAEHADQEYVDQGGDPGILDKYLRLMLEINAEDRADIGTLIQYLEQQVATPPRL